MSNSNMALRSDTKMEVGFTVLAVVIIVTSNTALESDRNIE